MLLQINFCLYQNVPCLASLVRPYNTGGFQLIHQSAGPIVA